MKIASWAKRLLIITLAISMISFLVILALLGPEGFKGGASLLYFLAISSIAMVVGSIYSLYYLSLLIISEFKAFRGN